MKVIASALIAWSIVFAAPAASADTSRCDAGEIVIDFSHGAPDQDHPTGEFARALAERVNAEMDGAACLRVFADGEKYGDLDVMEALLLGDVQLAAPPLERLQAYTLKYRLFDLPFLFDDMSAVDAFTLSADGRELLGAMVDLGFEGLGYVFQGMKQLSATRPLLYPVDGKGLVIRVQSSTAAVPMVEAIGATPRRLAFTDTVGALRSGAIQGQENTWAYIRDQRVYDVQDGVTETNHQAMVSVLITSLTWLDQLAPEVRDQFLAIVRDVERQQHAAIVARSAAHKNAILADGGIIRTLTPNQKKAWRNAVRHLWQRYSAQIGQDLIDAAIEANDAN